MPNNKQSRDFEYNKIWEKRNVIMVVEEILKQGKLFEFTVMWRQHFLDIMKPKYMPDFWSANRPLDLK